jgi:2-polyprenyl-6-methoxyphenol hydroxylase-like FAD-dependent oxidoreductase
MDIAIVGAGICGMCTAMSLARHGHRVTLFERDESPPDGDADEAFFEWNRKGAAQFRHPHAFLGLMCNLIEENYPELLEEFYKAGARRVDFEDMLSPELSAQYNKAPGDEKLWVLLCRRATMETVMRRFVETFDNVTIVNPCTVKGVTTREHEGVLAVTGIEIEDAVGERVHDAEVVIDASGRTSRFPGWFKALGRTVREEKDDAEIVYYTRHYRLKPGEAEPPRGRRAGAGDLGYLKFGVFPGDNGHFAIILCLPVDEKALKEAVRDPELFNAICLAIPGLEPWLAADRSVGTTDSFGIGDIQAIWRHYVDDGKPLATNFFAVGDAAMRTNPLYGRGCSTGVLHAHILAEVVDSEPDPVRRALAFDARTQADLRPIFDASLREDKSGIKRARAVLEGRVINQANTFKKRLGLAFGDALAAASREQVHVLRGGMRTFHLLEKPGDFLKDWRIRTTVLRYMLRGRRRNAAQRLQPGPERGEMHEILGIEPAVP